MTARGWRSALRIARRDARRSRGRSALIVAMIALPVLGMSAADVLARSAQLEPQERVSRELGSTQARLQGAAGRVMQPPDLSNGGWSSEGAETFTDPRTVAPAGYRVLTRRSAGVITKTRSGRGEVGLTEVDVADAAFAGMYAVQAGRGPHTGTEVAVTPRLLDHLGVAVGDTVDLVQPSRTVRVVGVVREVGAPGEQQFWALPGTLLPQAGDRVFEAEVFLAGDRPVTWDDVLALNEKGVAVQSRAVLLNPPPRSAVPWFRQGMDGGRGGEQTVFLVLGGTLVVVLAGLEVALLAGAAFAVGARRQTRSLAVLAAVGADRGHVRRVVLGGGVVLGAVGSVTGLGVGLLLAAVAMPPLERYASAEFGHFDVHVLDLLGIAAIGLLTGVLAAVLPARAAARQDPVAALAGRRGQVRTPRRVPVIGLALAVVGVAIAALGSSLALTQATGINPVHGGQASLVAGLIAGGAALAQIGLIVCSPALVGLAARWSRRLPLPARLAMRDAARHRGRSAPAVAAVLTAVTGSVAISLYVAALDQHDRQQYTPQGPVGTASVQLVQYVGDDGGEQPDAVDADRVLAALRPALPAFDAGVVRTALSCFEGHAPSGCRTAELVVPTANECPLSSLDREPTPAELASTKKDWRCAEREAVGSSLPGTPVGTAEDLALLTGPLPAEAARTLAAGGVVVFDRRLLAGGKALFDVVPRAEALAAADEEREPRANRFELPAALATPRPGVPGVVYSEGAARTMGLSVEAGALMMRFDRLPTRDQEDAALAALAAAGIDAGFHVERGYVSDYGLGLLALVIGAAVVTLGAAGIATGLAQADSRADHATLAAVGATPRLRRTLAAAQALSIAGLGTGLGILAGFVPAVAFIGALPRYDLVVPWLTLAEVLVGIPLVAATCAWLFTRSRAPLERRIA